MTKLSHIQIQQLLPLHMIYVILLSEAIFVKYYAPDYYGRFKCIADKCKHSCCIGWEIDVDEDTLALYDTIGGEIGERLQKNICRDGDCAHFVLGGEERCPFLNDRNLCDIILELGDGALCDICADHPRYRSFYKDRTEEGLGMSCEEAARIILTNPFKVKIVLTEDDGERAEADPKEEWFLNLRDKIIAMLQKRELPVDMRLMGVVSALGIDLPSLSPDALYGLYISLERLDEEWTAYLDRLRETELTKDPDLEVPYEQLLVYLVYRNLKAEDIVGTMKFCLISYLVICHISEVMGGSMEALQDVCRRYSAEIEYSDENIGRIINVL